MEVGSMLTQLDDLGVFPQIGICTVLVIFSLIFSKYAIIRPWFKLVKKTKNEWDDMLVVPISNRLYSFVLVGGINLSVVWIDTQNTVLESLMPFFSAIYIIISASIASVTIAHLVPVIMDRFTDKSNVTVSGSNPLLTFVFRAVIWFGAIYLALSELGIELMGLLASLAVFSLIIGLAVQQTLGNIVNSFMLAIDRPFEVGDRIEVDGMLGSVASVGILSTKILTREEKLVVIPNNTLVQTTVINHARGGGDGIARRLSIILDIGVDYNESIDHVKYTLLDIARHCPQALQHPPPRVLLLELGDYAKTFRVFVWIDDYTDEFIAKDWLLKSIDERFDDEGIVIPYPTAIELHGSPSAVEEAEISPRAKEQKALRKASRQRISRIQMGKEEKKLREERENAKAELELIKERLKDPELTGKDRKSLESDARELDNLLSVFDYDDD
ncbi:MAG TPA: mechanosensitive ion channel family protein [Candidatus Poseidoniaceae archaeon]|nr:mechanosensitive ion channel family protein [Candidatus Poseidoniaceae archaeon]